MTLLMRSNDAVLLSYVSALLADFGIQAMIADRNISAVEGSIGAFPCRVLVIDEQWDRARQLLEDAGLGKWCVERETE